MARNFTAAAHRVAAGTRAVPTAAGTFAAWWYPTFTLNDGAAHILFDCRNDGNNIFHLIKWTDNVVYAGWFTAASNHRVSVAVLSSGLVKDAWNSIVLTWDDATNETYLYINGTLAASRTASLATFTTTATRYLGNDNTFGRDARGLVAEVVICDRVWSTRERAAFDAGVLPNRIGPVDSYWPLWGTETDEPDLSGRGGTGTVTGATRGNHAPVRPASQRWWGGLPVVGALPPLYLSGSAQGRGSASGLLQVIRRGSGSAAGLAVVSATPLVSRRLFGASAGNGSAGATPRISRPLAGVAAGTGGTAACPRISRALSGAAAGAGHAAAVLLISLRGSAQGTAEVDGRIRVTRPLRGGSTGAGAVALSFQLRRLLQGQSAGRGTARAALRDTQRGPVCFGGSVAVLTVFGGTVAVQVAYGGSTVAETVYGGEIRSCGNE